MQQEMAQEVDRFEKIKARLTPWLVCVTASLFFFYEFIQGNMFASIADNIMQDFHIQAGEMTYLSSIYYLSNVIFLFVAGYILDRFSAKKTIIFAMLLCVLSTFLLAYAQTFYLALFSRFITGIGSAFCFLGPIRIASRWFPPKRMAMVTGVIVTIAMTGGMMAQYPMTQLVLDLGWRSALMNVAWVGTLILLFMLFWIKDSPAGASSRGHGVTTGFLETARKVYLNPQLLCAAVYTSLMNMAVAVFGAMMGTLYLMQRLQIDKSDASLVNSMLFLGALVGGPIVGWCSDQLSLRVLPMKIAACAALVTILSILYLPVSYPVMMGLFFILGFFTAAQVISYALVAESSPFAITATAVSIISIMTQGGYIIYQNLFSAVLLWHGGMRMINGVPVYSFSDYQTAALIIPCGLAIAGIVLFRLKETYCRHIYE